MTRRIFVATSLGLAATAAPGADHEAEGRKAAESWLALIDQRKYGESWDAAATMFRDKVGRARWEAMVAGVRDPLGALKSRNLIGARFTKQLPGVPDGEYVVVQFAASFANKEKAIETVTPMKDPDGVWRVSGYFIR